MTVNELIGEYIKKQRENKKLSLMDVSRIIGKNKSTIFGYEQGRNNITAETLMSLCKLYDVSLNEVYKYVESKL